MVIMYTCISKKRGAQIRDLGDKWCEPCPIFWNFASAGHEVAHGDQWDVAVSIKLSLQGLD